MRACVRARGGQLGVRAGAPWHAFAAHRRTQVSRVLAGVEMYSARATGAGAHLLLISRDGFTRALAGFRVRAPRRRRARTQVAESNGGGGGIGAQQFRPFSPVVRAVLKAPPMMRSLAQNALLTSCLTVAVPFLAAVPALHRDALCEVRVGRSPQARTIFSFVCLRFVCAAPRRTPPRARRF